MSNTTIMEDFHVELAKKFRDTVLDTPNNIFYITAGRSLPFEDDNTPPAPNKSVTGSFYDVHRETIFGKRIDADDVSFMVRYVMWEEGLSFDMYDDKDQLLHTKNFFVVSTDDSSTYGVFKCLNNGKLTRNDEIYIPPVFDKPLVSETNPEDEYYRTADGYVWKLMCVVQRSDFDKFATDNHFPINENQTIKENAIDGSIDQIIVEEPGNSYNAYAFGTVKQANVGGNSRIISLQTDMTKDILTFDVSITSGDFVEYHSGTTPKKVFFKTDGDLDWSNGGSPVSGTIYSINDTVIKVLLDSGLSIPKTLAKIYQTSTNVIGGSISALGDIEATRRDLLPDLSSNADFYSNGSFYIRSGKGAGQLCYINEYIVSGNERRIIVNEAPSASLDSTSRFEIGPRVIINGDGSAKSGVGEAKAVAILDESSNTISSIQMIDNGMNYSYASVSIVANTGYADVINGNSLQANTAVARAIISPPGGHGSDINNELFAKHICVSTQFSPMSSAKIPTQNDFRRIALVKDPVFNELVVTIGNSALLWIVDEEIYQASTGATAIIKGRQGSTLTLGRIKGFFESGSSIVSKRVSGNVTDTINTISRDFSVVDQRTHLVVTVVSAGTDGSGFIADEEVYQDTSNARGNIFGISSNALSIVNSVGVWTSSDTGSGFVSRVIGVTSGAIAIVESVQLPDIKKNSGKIMTIENVKPITRNATHAEKIKIILEF